MSDLRERVPGRAAMEKLLSFRGTDELRELPFGLVNIEPAALSWLRGARGARFMAAKLAKLGPEWVVLHSIPVGEMGWDIDHLVIGPAGVFPINTKRFIDADVVVDGDALRKNGWNDEKYLRAAALEARRVIATLDRAHITSPVLPIVAISGANRVKVKSSPRWDDINIGVTTIDKVVSRLRSRPPALSDQEIARAAEALSDSSAWSNRRSREPDANLLKDFQRIDRGVGRVRTLWLSLGGVVMIGAALVASMIFSSWVLGPLFDR